MAPLKWITITAISIIALGAGVAVYYYPSPSTSDDVSGEQAGRGSSGIELVISESRSTDSAIVTPNPYVKEFQLPKDNFPNGMLVDSNGTIWTVGSKSNSLIAFYPEQRKARAYPFPSSGGSGLGMVWTMAEDSDGSIWFSGSGKNPLQHFDPQTGNFESISSPSASPIQMKLDKDSGRIWYASLGGVIGVLQKEGQEYVAKELNLGSEVFPSGVYVQNQTLWITKSVDGKITLFDISFKDEKVADITHKAEFPEHEVLFSPSDIVINDGSAWITEHGTTFLTEYNFETRELRRYPTALHPIQISTLPYWLEEDSHEKGVWFNEHRGNRIAFFDFSTRTLTEYEVPTRNPQSGYIANVLTISADPINENRVWFTEFTEDKIGFVDRSVPVPFDISLAEGRIVLEEGQTAKINVEVMRKPGVGLFNNTLSFSASSSAVTSGVLLNATASFSPNIIDLSKVDSTQTVTLELRNEGMQKGQHILAVSATDGAVIRTVYLDLAVK